MRKSVSLGLVLVGYIVLGLAIPTYAIEYGGFGIRPAYPRPDNPRTESIFVHTTKPGETIEEGVIVANNTKETKSVLLYATDSTPSTDGGFACEQFSDEKDNVGGWITLEKTELTLAPVTSQTVKFTIKVPDNPPVGENDGCVVVQEKKADSAGVGSGVNLAIRSGLRVALTVEGEIHRSLEFVKLDLLRNTLDTGKKVTVLKPAVKNTGNVSVDADVNITTRYWTGWKLIQQGGQYPIFAGRTSEWNFELPSSFWGGVMIASSSVSYDPSLQAEVGKNTAGELKKIRGPVKFFWLMPTLWGFVIELLILLIVLAALFLLWLDAKRKKWMRQDWEQYKVKQGDNIVGLGKQFNVNWKLIAMRNKLRAPYILEPGLMLFVPGSETAPMPSKKSFPSGSSHKKLITVLADKGDTLSDIAKYAGISVSELAHLNKIRRVTGYKIKPGQEFIIPDPDVT